MVKKKKKDLIKKKVNNDLPYESLSSSRLLSAVGQGLGHVVGIRSVGVVTSSVAVPAGARRAVRGRRAVGCVRFNLKKEKND